MRQGYAFGTRIRIPEEIIKAVKCTTCLVTIYFDTNFGLITVLWLAILPAGSDEIFNFLLTSMKKEYNIPKLQIITEFTR